MDSSVKWPAFKSRFNGPCEAIIAKHHFNIISPVVAETYALQIMDAYCISTMSARTIFSAQIIDRCVQDCTNI